MFGPVITSVLYVFPISILIGTTWFLFIKGCLAFFNSIKLPISGLVQSLSIEYLAFAEMKSSFPIKFKFCFKNPYKGNKLFDNSLKILSISCCSSIFKVFIELLISNTDIGSM